ncbi:hypothetical protein CR513_10541, partial [Mucuna pruriens]
MNIRPAYSCLLGRSWIHAVGAVPSSLHQKVKFVADESQINILYGPKKTDSTSARKVVSVRPNHPLKSSPIRSGSIASSMSTIQQKGHLSSSSATTSFLEELALQVMQGVFEFTLYAYPLYSIFTLSFLHLRWCTVLHWCLFDRRGAGLRPGSRSLSKGTDWDFQHTLVDLILNAQASEGEPSPSMAIVVEDGFIGIWTTIEINDRTLKELATPDVVYQPWCIQYPQLESAQTYE